MTVATKPRGRPRQALIVEVPEEQPAERPTEETVEEKLATQEIETAQNQQVRSPFAKVYRVDEDTGEQRYCGRFPASAITEEWLGRKLGGGKFRVQFWKPTGKGGQFVYDSSKTYDLDRTITPEPARGNGAPPSGLAADDFMKTMLLQQMQTSSQLMQAIMTAVASMAQRPAADPVMLAMLQSMMTRKDPTEIATALLAVMKGESSDKNPIAMLKEMLEIKELMGGGGDAPNELSVVTKGLDVLGKVMTATPPALPAGNPPPLPSSPPTEPEPEQTMPRSLPPRPAPSLDVTALRPWHREVAKVLPRVQLAMTFLSPHAGADTIWNQGTEVLTDDVKADLLNGAALPLTPAGELDEAKAVELADGLVDRAMKALQIPAETDVGQWCAETIYEVADLAFSELLEAEPSEPEKPT